MRSDTWFCHTHGMGNLYLSHRLDLLAKALAQEISLDGRSPLASRLILVPNGSLKQWLLLQLTSYSAGKGVAGYKILTLREALPLLLPKKSSLPGGTELFFKIYTELSQLESLEIDGYLKGTSKRLMELSQHLSTLFLEYGEHGVAIFQKEDEGSNWQRELFSKLFVGGPFKLPKEVLSEKKSFNDPIHCFGFDFLPALFWDFLNEFSALAVYLFSPCFHYWDDLCTDREKKGWNLYWKKKGMAEELRNEWQDYWSEAPPLLANWGKLGRETIKILDRFNFDVREDYSLDERQNGSLLQKIQMDLLEFSKGDDFSFFSDDRSIQIFQAGSSRLREIEHLREVVLEWIQKEGLTCSEISVFAPDIDLYVPLIEYVFSDIPYRIFGASIESKSFFLQGLHRLLALGEAEWEKEDLWTLFETPSFFKKRNWDAETIEQFQQWFSGVPLNESGLQRLMERFIYLVPDEKEPIELSQGDLLESLIEVIVSLRTQLSSLQEKKMTLSLWADFLEELADQYLVCDLTNEADMAASTFFRGVLNDLRRIEKENPEVNYPLLPIQSLLRRKLQGQLHSSQLHAIRFSSLSLGSMTPNGAIFLIGMDEESFPRIKVRSSLDLLRGEKIYVPDLADEDRYLFLQTVFAARDFLFMSYRHLSADEGKPVGPSLVIQELLKSLGPSILQTTVAPFAYQNSLSPSLVWPDHYEDQLPEGEFIVSLGDLCLLARHPWKFYLQKKLGIYLEEEPTESFTLSKAKLLRASLTTPVENLLNERQQLLPPGICGEAIKLDLLEKIEKREEQFVAWGLKADELFSVTFKQSCEEKRWIGERQLEMPALEMTLSDRLRVRVIGEIKTVCHQGSIHLGDDHLSGLLKNWPEYLMASLSCSTSQIFSLKSGKIKTLQDPTSDLKKFLSYYFYALSAPSPLLNGWADALLVKGVEELEKKIRHSISGKGVQFEDLVLTWVLNRVELPSSEKIFAVWSPLLRNTFSGLVSLYPARGKAHAQI